MNRIVVIDDDADFCEQTRAVLESNGFAVSVANSPDEGLELVRAEGPALVILDVMMPNEFEGFAVARAIREDLGMRDLPLVMLTSVHERKELSYRFAPDEDYLPVDVFRDKPLPPAALLSLVRELLGEERQESTDPL